MSEGGNSKPIRCGKRWGMVWLMIIFSFLVAAMCLAFPFLINDEPLFTKVLTVATGFLFLVMSVSLLWVARHSTLYICGEGLGVQLGKGSIKIIHWDNVAKASERYPSPGVTTLCFRLKAYGPWLDQFSEQELRRFLSRGAIIYFLLGWAYIDRKLGGNEAIEAEIAAMPPKSLQRKLSKRMLRVRKEQGVDLIYSGMLCLRKDLEAIEASYLAWTAKHSNNS